MLKPARRSAILALSPSFAVFGPIKRSCSASSCSKLLIPVPAAMLRSIGAPPSGLAAGGFASGFGAAATGAAVTGFALADSGGALRPDV